MSIKVDVEALATRAPNESDELEVEPATAVLHRLAGAAPGIAKCIAVERGMRQPTRR